MEAPNTASRLKMPLPNGFFVVDPTIYWAYDKWCSLPSIKKIHPSATEFLNKFVREHCLVIEGPAIIIRISNITKGWEATVHAIVTGSEVYRHIEELKEVAATLVKIFDLKRLEAAVPTTFRAVNRLLEKCGFVYEATLRNAGRYDTMIVDINMWRFQDGIPVWQSDG